MPELGTHTELIFVDGSSLDGTVERIEEMISTHPERDIKLLRQRGAGGKAAAVFQGFDAARGEIVMILDADMTVAPEDLPRFYLALAEGVAEFANGTRFIHQMESGAMKPLNAVGNRLFVAFFSWLLGTRVTDTLCGTKALFRRDWPRISAQRPLFGGHDPWGDFDLLLGAACCGLRFIDVPIRYRARLAGESKMHAFRHGSVLVRTCLAGVAQLKLRRNRSPGV
jgi:glycosyltransferase involved in cell wall biosynthesis